MRRNLRNPRGGNRGVPAWQMQQQNGPRMSGGPVPLMSDQLGLQDIDKELELLKRKREIIEQQQQILSTDYRRNDYQDSYNQNQNQNTRFDDYAQLYDDMRNFEPSRKRPIAVWEDDIPSKRFSGGGGGGWDSGLRGSGPRSAASRLGPPVRSGQQGSAPRHSFRAQSAPFKPKPQPRRDPIPKVSSATNRVSKRPAAPPTNKLNTYPAPERKKLISPAAGTPPNANPKSYELDEANRLVAGLEPNKQVNGRLELALGHIIRDIREKFDSIVKAPTVMRRIKQSIRSRIRDVMMNKIVGQGPAIKAVYRELYNEDTDLDVVADALSDELKLVKIDNPKEYFKTNMFVIMHMKLKSLLEKLEITALEEYKNAEAGKESADETMETNPDEAAVAIKHEIENSGEESKVEIVEESTEKTEVAEEMTGPSAEINEAESATQISNTLDEKIIDTETYKTLEMLMTKQMTALLKKSMPQIIKLMDIDAKYTKLKNKITADTIKMMTHKPNIKHEEQSGDVSTQSNRTQTPGKRPPIPYFVKLMGKPSLPKRNLMQVFLDQFSPKSIKKHRAIHNLLFIGMVEKECFDKLLAADGTVIGKSTLSIRVSERSVPDEKTNNTSVADTSTNSELDTSNTDEKLIGTELDEQITDLLTSIREAEEEANVKDEVNDENADVNAEAEGAEASAEAEDADANGEAKDADANGEAMHVDTNADVTESADNQQEEAEAPQENGRNAEVEKCNQVTESAVAKPAVKGPAARVSARLAATPTRVQTRRTSRLN